MEYRLSRFVICLCWVMITAPTASAGLYYYVDEEGVHHYTNVPHDARYQPISLAGISRITAAEQRENRVLQNNLEINLANRYSDNSLWYRMDQHIEQAGCAMHVDPMLIRAIIKTESDFDPRAVSSKGAIGLMQLMPETARDLQISDPFDIRENIYGGTRYFRTLLDSLGGDIALSLAAYNAGPTRVMRSRSIPRFPETIAYVNKVMHWYELYKKQGMMGLTSINVRQLVTVN